MFSIFFAMSGFLLVGSPELQRAPKQPGYYYQNVPTLVVYSSGYKEADPDNLQGNELAREECNQLLNKKRALLVQKAVDIILDEESCQTEYWYLDNNPDGGFDYSFRYVGKIYFMN